MEINTTGFGIDDNSYKAAGQVEGLQKLSRDFYEVMCRLPSAKKIRDMHPDDLEISIDKLALFLSGWLGGPRLFNEKYGPIHIPKVHSHLTVGDSEREAWLECMEEAISIQNYTEEFSEYLLTQLKIPAARIQQFAKS